VSGPSSSPINQQITLTSQCTGGSPVTSWLWYGGGCGGKTTQACTVSESFVVSVDYIAVPSNAAGSGPAAHHPVSWTASVVTCQSQGVMTIGNQALSWTQDATYHSAGYGNFGNQTDWMFTITASSQPTPPIPESMGRLVISEYGGGPNARMANISTLPCDMRTVADPNGVNGPVVITGGTTATLTFGSAGSGPIEPPYLVLKGGVSYYANFFNFDGQQWSCDRSNCPAVLTYSNPQ
jgi:hypothetical protein